MKRLILTTQGLSKFCLSALACCLLSTAVFAAEYDARQRQKFLSLEKQLNNRDSAQLRHLIADLKGYPLHAYIWYEWLKRNLHLGADIADFQQQYWDSRYAKPLRYRQMAYFYEQGNWQAVINLHHSNDDEKQLCQYYWALYRSGERQQGLEGAAQLWAKGHSLPKTCDALLKPFVQSKYLTRELKWQRFRAALENKHAGLANYLLRFFNSADKQTARRWMAVHNKPEQVSQCSAWDFSMAQSGLIFKHGVHRYARRNLNRAIDGWDAAKHRLDLTLEQRQQVEQDLAIRLVKNRNHRANQRFKNLGFNNSELQSYKVKAALLAQDWRHVLDAVEQLDPELSKKDKWQYWRARAHIQLGQKAEGETILKKLAKERSFHGFIAADYLGLPYQLNDHPIVPDPKVTEQLLANVSFRAAQEFLALGRNKMARREWWFAISDLSDPQYLAAAKIAQQWNLPLLAVVTVARAKHWDDLSLRFPMAYQNLIEQYARQRGLDPAIVYGLIRRESVFNPNAMSPVGARGLMQIMPKTGRGIARELKERWRSKHALLNVETNIKYGTHYFKKLLNQFDGQYALAAAGYNAGPHRVKKWRPTNGAMPADIWIELIPFSETNKYVPAVLEYALIYQTRLNGSRLSMNEFLPEVAPKLGSYAQTEYRSSLLTCS